MAPRDDTWLFLVLTQPLPITSGVLVVLAMPVKNYLKWQAIQLAIHSIVSEQIDNKQLQNDSKFHASICFPSQVTVLQIIKIGTSKYLQIYIYRSQVFSNPVTFLFYNQPLDWLMDQINTVEEQKLLMDISIFIIMDIIVSGSGVQYVTFISGLYKMLLLCVALWVINLTQQAYN